MVHNAIERLATLFREAGAAHQKAFAATDGQDPEWARWYARYLAPRLQQELGGQVDQEALAADLSHVDSDYRAGEGREGEPWPEFYARWFIRRRQP
jgi:hypothetical protein